MGMQYSIGLGIGFIVRASIFFDAFETLKEEKFHMEDRWDPKTGKQLEPVKVVDEQVESVYTFNGEELEDELSVMEKVGNELNCDIEHGNENDEYLNITLRDVEYTDEDDFDDGRVSIGHSVSFLEVVQKEEELVRLATAFRDRCGIKVGNPKVFCSLSIG
jgi:hypothetical protein